MWDKYCSHFINNSKLCCIRRLSWERFIGLSLCSFSFTINKVGNIFHLDLFFVIYLFVIYLHYLFIMFYYLQLMVKEGWKMKVDQSVDFSTLTLLPKVTIMTVDYLSVKCIWFWTGRMATSRKDTLEKKAVGLLNSSSTWNNFI